MIKDGDYPKQERQKIDSDFYDWKEFYTKAPFYCGDVGNEEMGFKAKLKSYREFPRFGYCANLGLLAKYQYTWERRLKLYSLLLAILFDYIHWRVVYSKNSIDFKMFLLKQDPDHNGQIRLVKPSKAEFLNSERHLMNVTRFRTQYVYRKVHRPYEFTRSQKEAKKSIKELNDLVKEYPRTINWKAKQNK